MRARYMTVADLASAKLYAPTRATLTVATVHSTPAMALTTTVAAGSFSLRGTQVCGHVIPQIPRGDHSAADMLGDGGDSAGLDDPR